MRRLLTLAAAACLVGSLHADQAPPVLQPGKPVARDVAPGDTHSYRIAVRANDAVHVVARQLGADIVLTLLDADAKSLVEMDTPTGTTGSESIWFVAPRAGELVVRVQPFERSAGRYEIQLATIRAATVDDSRRVRAQTLMVEAFGAGPGDTAAAIAKLKEGLSIVRSLGDADATGVMLQTLADLDTDAALDAMGIEVIAGSPRAYYSNGFRERAETTRREVERIAGFFEQALGVKATVSVAVLTPEAWSAVCFGGVPYGMPNARSSRSGAGLVCIGATHEFSDGLARSLKAQLPPKDAATVEASLGMPLEQALRRFGDTILAHELGHIYTLAFGISPPAEWMNELLASYLEIAYRSAHPPGQAEQQVRTLLDTMRARRPLPAHTTLQDFERLYVEMARDNYVWYQEQFARRAQAVFDSRGLAFLKDVKTAFPPNERRPVALPVALERLEKIAPGFVEWAGALGKRGAGGAFERRTSNLVPLSLRNRLLSVQRAFE